MAASILPASIRRRAVAGLVAVFIGLGALGATAGAALGSVGAASTHGHDRGHLAPGQGGPGVARGDDGFGPGRRLPPEPARITDN